MTLLELIEEVSADVTRHCKQAKGFVEEPFGNPLAPVDCVAAFAMAKHLTERESFDHYVAVAPEGHVYGYFFAQLGIPVLSVYVDYPPTRLDTLDDLTTIANGRVLVIEDDVASGVTLRFVVQGLQQHRPRSLALYLGRCKEDQILENVATGFEHIYLAEDCLDPTRRAEYEAQFVEFFARR